jgi:hypothetical protein
MAPGQRLLSAEEETDFVEAVAVLLEPKPLIRFKEQPSREGASGEETTAGADPGGDRGQAEDRRFPGSESALGDGMKYASAGYAH